MRTEQELSDINIFFYYGNLDLDLETEHDLFLALIQPNKSFFYNRINSSKVASYENYPNTLIMQIGLRYDIMQWNGWRNTVVSDGTEGTIDRRIAISQDSIIVEQEGSNMNLEVYYIPFFNYLELKSVSKQIGITNE